MATVGAGPHVCDPPLSHLSDPVAAALKPCRAGLLRIALFSGAINMLTFAGSIYMLQVYDRVIPGRNIPTLISLSVLVLTAYVLQGVLDCLRMRMLARLGAQFDLTLQVPIHRAVAALPLMGTRPGVAEQPLQDLECVRLFLSGMGPTAFLDMPWMPVFLLALFLFHPVIGTIATLGALAIIAVTLLSERLSVGVAETARDLILERRVITDGTRRNAEAIRALGMTQALTLRWMLINERVLCENLKTMDIHAGLGALGKGLRYTLQSGILCAGAVLVISDEASGGIIIASSIMMGRALAPIEVALGTWRQLTASRLGLQRLRETLKACATLDTVGVATDTQGRLKLPRPCHSLCVETLAIRPPGSQTMVLTNVSFSLKPGQGLAVVGPSASGKTSLVRALVGIWPTCQGSVRLDGAELKQWHHDDLGRHLGYLPQDAALFDGTVAQNIARFEADAAPKAVIEAARLAGVHEIVLRLPHGYHTRIGESGVSLSAGQRQRIGLARAVYGHPFLVVLDEPNANLDGEGEQALARAIAELRARHAIVIVVSHRPAVVRSLDMALVLMGGRAVAFGTREDVGRRLAGQPTLASRATINDPMLAKGSKA